MCPASAAVGADDVGRVGQLAEVDELGRRDRVVEAAGARPLHGDVVQPHRATLSRTRRKRRIRHDCKAPRPADRDAKVTARRPVRATPESPADHGATRRRPVRQGTDPVACGGSRGRRGSGALRRSQGTSGGAECGFRSPGTVRLTRDEGRRAGDGTGRWPGPTVPRAESSRSRSAGDRGDRRVRPVPRVSIVALGPRADAASVAPNPRRRAPAPGRREKVAEGGSAEEAGVRRRVDHRARGPRGGPQAPRHVHRFDRRARPAPPGLGGRRQRGRRGAGRLLRHHRRRAARRRRRPRHRQRPWFPGRPAPQAEEAGRRGRADRAARRWQVRRQGVRGLRRSARRRRLGGQRAVHEDGGGDPQGRLRLAADTTPTPSRARWRRARPPTAPARRSRSGPTRRSSRPPSSTSRRSTAGCRRWRSSTAA